MSKARLLPQMKGDASKTPVIGVFTPCDPRIDKEARKRSQNIIAMVAGVIAKGAKLPCGGAPEVVYTDILVDGEAQADLVAKQFREAGVDILVMCPDTWAFPQLTALSVLGHFHKDTPLNITCGNSGSYPGVVFAHAVNGALAQSGRLAHLNVGNWPSTGANPKMSPATEQALLDWCQAALARVGLRGRRVVLFGHDSMGMETALAHVIPTRNAFGLEIARLDMKLPADMLAKGAYDRKELKSLRSWIGRNVGARVELSGADSEAKLEQSLAMYLVVRDLMKELNAVGGGFMNQLEWGSDRRGLPLATPDIMESLFNTTFDHAGRKEPLPFATEADTQALLTMLFFTWISGGNPPLFMDFRKVWEPWELRELAESLKVKADKNALWLKRGLVDGVNSGSASLNWAALPGAKPAQVMEKVSLPAAVEHYFPGGGNSVTFISPGGIEGIAGRLSYSAPANRFGLVWDEACTVELPEKIAQAVAASSDVTWPHTWVCPKYATMAEYKQYAPANHFHMTWGLRPAALEYWMDLAGVLSLTPWAERPAFIAGVDRPKPLLHVINGGENAAKLLL